MKFNLTHENFKEDYGRKLLLARGVKDIEHFLKPDESCIQSPFDLDYMGAGVSILERALASDAPTFALVVDSDVDGFTSSSIIYQYIKSIRPDAFINYYLHEGKQHGLSDVVEKITDDNEKHNYNLVIVPDAGSNDFDYIEQLKEINLPVLILDHHIVEEDTHFSDNAVIINNQLSPKYKNKSLSGAGVTYQFCRAYDMSYGLDNAKKFIDLAALGIDADMMSMLEPENQYFMHFGFSNVNNFFFQVLLEKQAYSMNGEVNPISVAFYIVPMINAMIRIGTMEEKNRLFLAFIDGHSLVPSHKRGAKGTMEQVAIESARECTNAKAHQDKFKKEAVDRLEIKIFNNNLLDNKILFVRLDDDDNFPAELNGLVAMQLSAKYKKPTIVARLNPEGMVRGSARGLNQSELKSFKNYLGDTGLFEYTIGHDNAFGISIPNSKLSKLHELANEQLGFIDFDENVYDVDFVRTGRDSDLSDLIIDLSNYSDVWGQMNSEPLVAITDMVINKSSISIIGKNKNTVKFSYNGVTFIKFFANDLIEKIEQWPESTLNINIVGKANLNSWMGQITPQIIIEDYEITKSKLAF